MKDKIHRKPSRMTARELLVEAFGVPREEHATHSVRAWGTADGGGLQILCTCFGFARMPDSDVNRLALQNVPELEPDEFDEVMTQARARR